MSMNVKGQKNGVFLCVAEGSYEELRTQLYLAIELGYVETQNGQSLIDEAVKDTDI